MMEERVCCLKCQASILPETAVRHGGICKPCYKRELHTQLGGTAFGRTFDKFSVNPKLRSDRFFDLWLNFDHLLSGPLYHLRCNGHCDYIFRKRQEQVLFFRDISAFETWGLSLIEKFRMEVKAVKSGRQKVKKDRRLLLRKADEAVKLIRLATLMLEDREKHFRESFQ